MLGQIRNLALLNLAIDSKLRGCDLVSLKVSDVFSAGSVRERAMVIQRKNVTPSPIRNHEAHRYVDRGACSTLRIEQG